MIKMARGRKVGTTEVSLTEIKTIIEMTKEGFSRRQIADSVNKSKKTVYNYQIKYGIL